MYDWIPMEFDFDILKTYNGHEYAHYYCIANDEDRRTFKVFYDDHIVLSTYLRASLLDALNAGSKINGMTMEELKSAYYGDNSETTIDICGLI